MRRDLGWILMNIGIAVGVVTAGIAVVAGTDPEPGGFLENAALVLFLALWLTPTYVPTVVAHLLLLALLARRFPGRVPALVLAPLAPGFLWYFVLLAFDLVLTAVALVGTAVYGGLVRLPGDRDVRPVLVAGLVAVLPVIAFGGGLAAFGIVLVALLGLWIERRRSRARPVTP
jgi:hypothetical protein